MDFKEVQWQSSNGSWKYGILGAIQITDTKEYDNRKKLQQSLKHLISEPCVCMFKKQQYVPIYGQKQHTNLDMGQTPPTKIQVKFNGPFLPGHFARRGSWFSHSPGPIASDSICSRVSHQNGIQPLRSRRQRSLLGRRLLSFLSTGSGPAFFCGWCTNWYILIHKTHHVYIYIY